MKDLLKYICFLVMVIAFSCTKRPFNYRNKYLGDYEFKSSSASWTSSNGPGPATSNVSQGQVYYKFSTKDQIIIKIGEEETTCRIEENGDLYILCGSDTNGKPVYGAKIGSFENKDYVSLNYGSNSCCCGGLGGGANYSVIGTKKPKS